MIVFRVDARIHTTAIDRARTLFGNLTRASRTVPGVVCFDILQDPDDPARFVSIEVYEDQAALDRQGALPQLQMVMAALDELLTDGPHGTIFHVASTEPWPAT